MVEATVATRVASNAWVVPFLRHLEQDHIAIAIDTNIVHGLHVTRLFALEPKLVARAAEVDRAFQFSSEFKRLAVHPCEHEYVAGGLLLGDDWDEAFVVVFDFV